MHLHFERSINTKCDCSILSLTWMGKVPDELPEDEGWKLNRTNYYQEGWLATGNVRGIVGVTFTTSHCKKNVDFPLRTNYNLRGHRSEVILVKWNEPYQKLASCDSSGIIFVWIKYEGRWSIELINDRNTPVTHFSWSHDGRMALICYQDGFVLVGSVAGQRYWSSMLNLESTITCGIWTPDDQQVYFGTTAGHIIVMDVHGAMVSQVQLSGSEVGISAMAWSCEKFKMEEGDDTHDQTAALNHSTQSTTERKFVLAVCLQNGYIFLLKTFDDVSPVQVDTGLQGLCMEWSNSRELLAVAGTAPPAASPLPGAPQYRNVLKFYSDNGVLLYTTDIPCAQAPVSALTWGHNDKRLFIATGTQVHIAWVSRRVASLQLMCRLQIHNCLRSEHQLSKLPLPPRIRNLIGNLFAQTIRCCVPEISALREFVSRPPVGSVRLHCTMIRHDDDSNLSSGTCYTLYLEYLGGLVPLLKGKRTSKIRPEFVIFDPQVEELCGAIQCSPDSAKSSSSSSHSGSGSGSTGIQSDSSDSEHDEGCSGSPRLQRRRRKRNKSRSRTGAQTQTDKQQPSVSCPDNVDLEDLAYIDTLPEHVRLVEVTSNIWGTKFKIHGLASSVPANLGQVTYKTSLLHLQPRQMTLVMTELRDDVPPGPDPNFNPNLFSEDEEDATLNNGIESASHFHKGSPPDIAPPIAPMSPLATNRLQRPKSQVINHFMNPTEKPAPAHFNNITTAESNFSSVNSNLIPAALARAESYEDEFPYVDLTEMVNFCESLRNNVNTNNSVNNPSPCSSVRPVPIVASPVQNSSAFGTQFSRNPSVNGSQGRHAISPLCCDGSVPALQSPKNAVAPSDIIFDRPPITQTMISYQTATNCSNNMQQVKSALLTTEHNKNNNLSSIQRYSDHISNKNGVNLNLHLNLETNKTATSKNNTEKTDNVVNNLNNKSRSNDITNQTNIMNTGKRKAFCSNKHSPIGNQIGIATSQKFTNGKPEELKYIDEDLVSDITEASSSGMKRTTTVPSNSPYLVDAMVRSCSVGYLDLVDAQLVPSDLTLAMLKKDTPKRLVLVSRKTRHKKQVKKQLNSPAEKDNNNVYKSPKLSSCGKSKSLDSSDILPVFETHNVCQLPDHAEETTSSLNDNKDSSDSETSKKNEKPIVNPNENKPPVACNGNREITKLSFFTASKTPTMKRKNNENSEESVPCQELVKPSRTRTENVPSSTTVKHSEQITRISTETSTPVAHKSSDSNTETTRCTSGAVSLHTHALATLENLLSRIRELDDRGTPPASPVLSTRLPRSSPSSPAPSKKGKRHQSASPIRRHLLNSPLLGRRSKKYKNIESSDDEVTTAGSGDEVVNGKNYRDLETFQKAQLRQKLKRGKIEPNGTNSGHPSPFRREFVMHNKAPMWNENSQVYQLDFGGRVTQESAKNFQIEFRGKQVMQFGRIDGNAYTLDFQYPFSALQAFAVALANVTQRLK